MKPSAAQLSGLQYELAMALSSSLELEPILEAVLSVLLRQLDGRTAVVLAGDGARTPLVALPRAAAAMMTWLQADETRADGSTEQPLHRLYLEPNGVELHRFSLSGFGVLVLERRGPPLPAEVMRALEPLMERLGRAARACLDHATVRASEARFSELAATVPEVIFECRLAASGELSFDYVSPRGDAVLGLDPATLVEQPRALVDRLHPDDREGLVIALGVAASRRESFEHRVRLGDGGPQTRWLRIAANPRGPREDDRFSGLMEDISAQQQVATAEREAARLRMSSLLGLAGDAMVGADSSGRITHWNRAAEALLGYPASTILGEPLAQIMPERMRAAHAAGMARHMATGESGILGRPVELPALHADGREVQVELLVSRVEDGGEVFFIAVLRDLTERLRAERERARSVAEEQRFASALVELGRVALTDPVGLHGRLTSIVAAVLDIARVSVWSLDPASITCLDLFEAVEGLHSAGLVLEEQAFRPYFAALREESVIIAPDARTHRATSCFRESYLEPFGIVSMLDVPVRTLAGVEGVLCMEATERRDWRDTEVRFCLDAAGLLSQARERMVRARLEARHKIVLASIDDAVIACDTDQTVTLINPAAERLTGWTAAKALGRPLREVVRVLSAETSGPVDTLVTEVLASGIPGPKDVVRLLVRDEEQILIAKHADPILELGRLTGAVLTFRDVREREASRRALEEQNRKLHALREAIPDMLFSVTIDGQIQYQKTVPTPDLLVPPEELSAHTIGSLFPPETAAQLLRAVSETIRTDTVQTVEYAVERRTFEARFAPLSDFETTVIVRNVTEERSREDALRAERAWLQVMLSSASAVIYSLRLPDFAVDYISESVTTMLGFTTQQYLQPRFWELAVHPSDLPGLMSDFGRILTTGRMSYQYRHRHADGNYRWLQGELQLVRDSDGRPERFIGASFDVTDLKRSESRTAALLAVQQIVTQIGAAFLRGSDRSEELAVDEALDALGRLTRADRAYVFDYDGLFVNNTHEWCREGIIPQKSVLQRLPAGDFEFFLRSVMSGTWLHIPAVSALPPEAQAEKDLLSAQGIESLLAVPLMDDGSVRGFVGIDNPDLDPLSPSEFADLMQLMADTLVSGRRRTSSERALRQLNERLTRTSGQQRQLLDLSIDVARATSREELFVTLRNRLRPLLKADRVSMMERLDDGRRHLFRLLDSDPESATGAGTDMVSARTIEREVGDDIGGSAPALAMECKAAVTSRQYRLSDFPDWIQLQEVYGYNQFMVVPLLGTTGVFGTLNVAFTRAEPPTAEEVDWVSTFAAMLAAHLTLHEAREALQQLNLALETRVELRTRELRASEERFEQLFREAPQAMLIVDAERRVVQSNHRAQSLFRIEEGAFVGTPISELVPVGFRAQHDRLMDGFIERRDGPTLMTGINVPALRVDGSAFSAEIVLVPIDLNGEPHVLAGVTDVTDQLEAQAAVTRSLQEKETLLKEIHHRVKNNLQVISSLLMLQSEQMPSTRARELLAESVQRVRSMALVHQQLYGVESLERIDLGDYARTLAESLRGALAQDARLRVDASVVEVTVDTAVPFGLILNELLTNAFKYGLPQRGEGGEPTPGRTGEGFDIVVEVGIVEERIRVAVTDSGKGPPDGFDPARSSGLGLQLVRTLSRQLRGTLELDVDRGSRFAVTCPRGLVRSSETSAGGVP
ncbi:MAG: PAS domain S-box protein [Deltaproteobacteria bacterium]|nr:PAS domain S-box protein [Deltaproteobacteria bacterium]